MTLAKQTTLMMICALTIIFICTFIITINHTKSYFEEQLQRHAQDTATVLGLTMSNKKANDAPDLTNMLLTISAVFDRGYFSSIQVRDRKGQILVKRYLKEPQNAVPMWFVKLIGLKNNKQSALIMHGWQQIGEVEVSSDDSLALATLWLGAKRLFLLFLLTTLGVIFISLLFIKAMFKSLNRIVRQAEDIGKHNFYCLDQLPKLVELKRLSLTMNSMVEKLKLFFSMQVTQAEQLRAKAYQDSLTNKGNRRYFFQQFNQYLSDEGCFTPGFLFLFEITGLAKLNRLYGYQEGDQAILKVSEHLDGLFSKESIYVIARLDGPSFAAVILEDDKERIETYVQEIEKNLQHSTKSINTLLSCHVSVVKCRFGDSSANLLANADKIIKSSQNFDDGLETELEKLDHNGWKDAIKVAIEGRNFNFYCQPVKFGQEIYHQECFVKMLRNSVEISASYFFPIVDRYFLGGGIDQLVLQEVAKIQEQETFAINLSNCTVTSEEKQKEFLMLLKNLAKRMKSNVHFELSEFMLLENMSLVETLIDGLTKLGYTVGLDRVGATLVPLTYLKKLNLKYLKLDGALSKGIDKNKLKQDIIANWVQTAERFELILIATNIESESQWQALAQLGILYFQGNYIRSPILMK